MRVRLTAMAFAIVLTASVAAGIVGWNRRGTHSTATDWSRQSHDLGIVFFAPGERQALRLTHVFDVPNPSSTGRMLLRNHSTSCGCTQAVLDAGEVLPGDTAKVKVTIDAAAKADHVNETALLSTGLAQPERISLSLRAYLLPRVEAVLLTSDPVLRVPPGQTSTVQCRITGRQGLDEPEAAITCVPQLDSRLLKVELAPPEVQVIDNAYRATTANATITIRCPETAVDPSRPVGREMLRFRFAGWEVEQPVVWRAQLAIQSHPNRLLLQRRGVEACEREVLLQGPRPFRVVRAHADRDDIDVLAELSQSSGSHRILVRIRARPADAPVGRAEQSEIVVTTDFAGQLDVRVPVFVIDAP